VGSVKTWFNPDNQAVLQWAFLHNLAADGSYNDNGTTIEVNSFASAESNVKVDASLVHNPPGPGNTTGFLRVDCGWVGNWTDNVTHAIMRDIRMHIRFGLAYIDLFRDQNNFPYCMVGVGVDGYGQPFAKAGSYMMGAGTGSFGIGINEFASPLNESSGASIRRFPPPDDTPAYATSCVGGGVYGSFYDQQTWAEGDIFQGTFEIWANQP
jgi:hypothetical protein